MLQGYWVVSVLYNGDVWGLDIVSKSYHKGKSSKEYTRPFLSKEKTTVMRKGVGYNQQKLYNATKKSLQKCLKSKYKNFEIVLTNIGAKYCPFKVKLDSYVKNGCWGSATIISR